MKKIALLLLLMAGLLGLPETKAQPGTLDTVNIASFTQKASEWAYYMSYLNGSNDSADIAFLRKVRDVVRAQGNLTWNSNVTVTNIPGKYIVAIYDIGRRIPGGEAIQVGIAALTTITAITHPVISYYVGVIDAGYAAEFTRHRTLGKNLLID